MKIGVLALQGAFIEHERRIREMGGDALELRERSDLSITLDGIVLPGGESTVQMKLLKESGMYAPIKALIEDGIPVLGTCAGLILLSQSIDGQSEVCFSTLPVTVRRNAYGRQLSSFHTSALIEGSGIVEMTFIRAPVITEAGEGVEILGRVNGEIVAVKYGSQYGLSFHPELESLTESEWIYRRVFNL